MIAARSHPLVTLVCEPTNDARAQQIEKEIAMLNRRLSNLTLPLDDFLELLAWRRELRAELAQRQEIAA